MLTIKEVVMTESSIKHKKSTIISKGSDKPKSTKSTHYVSNVDLYEAFVKWYAEIDKSKIDGTPEPQMPSIIAKGIIDIAENLAKKANWMNVSHWKSEMIGNAIENCIRYAKNFDINKTKNPFSYFTQTCYYAFLRTIEDEQITDYVKHKSMLLSMATKGLHDGLGELDEHDVDTMEYNQNGVEKFIKDFEVKRFGQELALDEGAGNAGKRRRLLAKQEQNITGFF